MGSIFSIYLVLYFFVFPGFIGVDEFYLIDVLRNGKPSGWHSMTYSAFYGFGVWNFGLVGWMTGVNLLLFGIAVISCASLMIDFGNRRRSWVIFGALLVHPISISQVFYQCRDTTFSLLLIVVMLQLLRFRGMKIVDWISVLFLFVVLVDLRQEAILYLAAVAMIVIFAVSAEIKKRLCLLGLTAAALWGTLSILPEYFSYQRSSLHYKVTAFAHPLSVVYHLKGREQIPQEIDSPISEILNTDYLIKYYNPNDIDPIHMGAFNHSANQLQFDRALDAVAKLFLQEWRLILGNRIEFFNSMMNTGRPSMIFNDYLQESGAFQDGRFMDISENLKPRSLFPELKRWISQRLMDLFHSSLGVLRFFTSLWLPLCFCLTVIAVFKTNTVWFWLATLILIRVPIVFALAPATYFKYLQSLWWFTVFFLPLVFLVRKSPQFDPSSRGALGGPKSE
ncbi:MAG: hypothetical protein LW875_05275 [Proteobacteria bacterium]|jgi:hypothetical protein|nr:hypothetical protein [Pseudomonadota bacterium]